MKKYFILLLLLLPFILNAQREPVETPYAKFDSTIFGDNTVQTTAFTVDTANSIIVDTVTTMINDTAEVLRAEFGAIPPFSSIRDTIKDYEIDSTLTRRQEVIDSTKWTEKGDGEIYRTGAFVGIGTTDPTNQLHVIASTTVSMKLDVSGGFATTSNSFIMQTGGTNRWGFGQAVLNAGHTFDIYDYPNGKLRFNINNAGYVGFNDWNSGTPLTYGHFNFTDAGTTGGAGKGILISNYNNTTGNLSSLWFGQSSTDITLTSGIEAVHTNRGVGTEITNLNYYLLGAGSKGLLLSMFKDSLRMNNKSITNVNDLIVNNSIGINTNSPTKKLDVNGTTILRDTLFHVMNGVTDTTIVGASWYKVINGVNYKIYTQADTVSEIPTQYWVSENTDTSQWTLGTNKITARHDTAEASIFKANKIIIDTSNVDFIDLYPSLSGIGEIAGESGSEYLININYLKEISNVKNYQALGEDYRQFFHNTQTIRQPSSATSYDVLNSIYSVTAGGIVIVEVDYTGMTIDELSFTSGKLIGCFYRTSSGSLTQISTTDKTVFTANATDNIDYDITTSPSIKLDINLSGTASTQWRIYYSAKLTEVNLAY